jgi:hypothetical protein
MKDLEKAKQLAISYGLEINSYQARTGGQYTCFVNYGKHTLFKGNAKSAHTWIKAFNLGYLHAKGNLTKE